MLSPSPNDSSLIETPAQADSTTVLVWPRISSMRSVSVDKLAVVAPISQKRCPNTGNPLVGLTSFSMRSVPLPANGLVLLTVGVVE